MRSRDSAERVLRIVAFAALTWYLAFVLVADRRGVAERATSVTLRRALERWSTSVSPPRVHVELAHPPAGDERDWLAALRGAATGVEWRSLSLLPTAIDEEPRVDPARGVDVSIAAPVGTMTVLADTLGVLDSARATAGGVHAYLPTPRATVEAIVGAVVARAARRDSLTLKRLLVIGAATWETKFTVAALEERGWAVDAEVAISPKHIVRQGTVADIDTARYSAVLAIDSTAAPYGNRIARFVGMGGGAVLWAPAAKAGALAALAPGGSVGTAIEDEDAAPTDTAPRQVLALTPIASLRPGAIVLERRGDLVSVAARRLGLGRVIETGYTSTWRWRLAGGADAPERHRDWLAGLVAGVAYAGRSMVGAPPTDVAPLASLIDHLGPASTTPEGTAPEARHVARWVFLVVVLSLLAEWASRRLRGVK